MKLYNISLCFISLSRRFFHVVASGIFIFWKALDEPMLMWGRGYKENFYLLPFEFAVNLKMLLKIMSFIFKKSPEMILMFISTWKLLIYMLIVSHCPQVVQSVGGSADLSRVLWLMLPWSAVRAQRRAHCCKPLGMGKWYSLSWGLERSPKEDGI